MKKTVALIVGTRPEAVKMAPVHRALVRAGLQPVLISTGQHRELLETALAPLGLAPDHELAVMTEGQTPNQIAARVLERLPPLLESVRPAALLVQGDTTTSLAAALCAYHLQIPVGHVEAGLRTYDHEHPFPEEANRQLADRLCRWCFAPTEGARRNLLSERIDPAVIHVTGNTAVDSLLWMLERSKAEPAEPYLLVTLHRRESFGDPLRSLVGAVRDFLDRTPEATALWPVHPNPNVAQVAEELLAEVERVRLVEPMGYAGFARALAGCRIVLSDSGGIQEEAPSLGKIVLVARETTERPEALEGGRNRLVGRDRETVARALAQAWQEEPYSGPLPALNPYGDGRAGERIAEILKIDLGGKLH
ncbi:MAG TPA: UDP-N-acetylglucosamine 2-epimerase (non-hydrolyzing) [Thermoanaerobaculia bacterium]|jgi:UDP-N-acetylglucosamine 2-epimerase (non-hydrolysing)|nr:UDP-N-acetylglucosamine 2-epimerase (non-hydrolyzing) [Thermoanaerobaculia bacterium]